MINCEDFCTLVTICKNLNELLEPIFPYKGTKAEIANIKKNLDIQEFSVDFCETIGELKSFIDSKAIEGSPEDKCGRIGVGNFAAAGGDIVEVKLDNKVFNTSDAEELYQYISAVNTADIIEEETVDLTFKD